MFLCRTRTTIGGTTASSWVFATSSSVGLVRAVLVDGVAVLLLNIARFATGWPDLRASSVVVTLGMPLEGGGEVFMVGMMTRSRQSLK